MDIGPYIARLREDLTTAAAAGDDQTRRTAALLGTAVEPAARLVLLTALSDLAAEITAALGDRVVDVRLDGRDARVVVSGEPAAPPPPPHAAPPPPPPPPPPVDAGDISRITLRLVEQIKGQAEQAAAAQGVSLNSWLAQTVQGALSGRGFGGPGAAPGPGRPDGPTDDRGAWSRHDRDGRRLRGWVEG